MVNPDLSIKPHKEAVKGCLDYWHKRIYLKRKQTLSEVLKIVNAKYPDDMYSGEILNKLSEWLEQKLREMK